eukprot:3935450-Rhodomonas_salina.2
MPDGAGVVSSVIAGRRQVVRGKPARVAQLSLIVVDWDEVPRPVPGALYGVEIEEDEVCRDWGRGHVEHSVGRHVAPRSTSGIVLRVYPEIELGEGRQVCDLKAVVGPPGRGIVEQKVRHCAIGDVEGAE